MKPTIQMALPGRTYEMHNGEWHEVERPSGTRLRSLLHGVVALFATAFIFATIAVIGIVATTVALVLSPLALLAAWSLRTFTRRTSSPT